MATTQARGWNVSISPESPSPTPGNHCPDRHRDRAFVCSRTLSNGGSSFVHGLFGSACFGRSSPVVRMRSAHVCEHTAIYLFTDGRVDCFPLGAVRIMLLPTHTHVRTHTCTHTRLCVGMFSFLRQIPSRTLGPRDAPGGVSRSFPAVRPCAPAESLRDTRVWVAPCEPLSRLWRPGLLSAVSWFTWPPVCPV